MNVIVRIQCQSETSCLSPLWLGKTSVWSHIIPESDRWRAHSIFSGHQNGRRTRSISQRPVEVRLAIYKTNSKSLYRRRHNLIARFPLNHPCESRFTKTLMGGANYILFSAAKTQDTDISMFLVRCYFSLFPDLIMSEPSWNEWAAAVLEKRRLLWRVG